MRQCPHCGEDVVSLSYQVKRYCNNICYQRFQRAKTKKIRKQRICLECSEVFTPKRDNHFWCSNHCRKVFQSRYFKEHRAKYKKKERHACRFCGQLFVPSHYFVKYCSTGCKRAYEASLVIPVRPKVNPNFRDITEDDLKTSNHAKEIAEFKKAGGKVQTYPTLPGPKILNTGSTKGSNVDAEWSVKDLADLDEYEDVLNMKI